MENEIFSKYFLAANSGVGFYSKFADNYGTDWTAYIIKGGPGTGKSSLMRRFAAKAQEKNIRVILCPCSSDPDSIDAVILPDSHIIMLDGTAPHVVEPKNPGVCEQIINTGAFWDKEVLKSSADKIAAATKENKAYHKKAAAYITAAGSLKRFNFSHALNTCDINSCFEFGSRLAHRYIRVRGIRAQEWVRFLGGVTPKGYVFFDDTIDNEADRRVIIRDEFGAAASIILSAVRDYALSRHHEIITVKNPILPEEITDAIFIPDLRLAFLREEYEKLNSSSYKINAHRFYDTKQLGKAKEKCKFNKKAVAALLTSAADCLRHAKLSHDKLEKHYVAAMDFAALERYTTQLLEKII